MKIKIFGSLLRPNDFHIHSDVDIIIIDRNRVDLEQIEQLANAAFKGKNQYDLLEMQYLKPEVLKSVQEEGVEHV